MINNIGSPPKLQGLYPGTLYFTVLKAIEHHVQAIVLRDHEDVL